MGDPSSARKNLMSALLRAPGAAACAGRTSTRTETGVPLPSTTWAGTPIVSPRSLASTVAVASAATTVQTGVGVAVGVDVAGGGVGVRMAVEVGVGLAVGLAAAGGVGVAVGSGVPVGSALGRHPAGWPVVPGCGAGVEPGEPLPASQMAGNTTRWQADAAPRAGAATVAAALAASSRGSRLVSPSACRPRPKQSAAARTAKTVRRRTLPTVERRWNPARSYSQPARWCCAAPPGHHCPPSQPREASQER